MCYIDDLVQDCSNSIANALELLQSCTKLSITFSSTNGTDCVANMEALICDIRGWYTKNMLKLNDDKTEVLIIGSKYCQIPQIPDLHIGSSVITPASHVTNLEVIMDSNFTMQLHINDILKAIFFKMREMSYYRRFLTPSCAKTLIHADITSKLYYCNGLLYGLPSQQLNRLQSILNTAARLVTMTRNFDHITPNLRDLHRFIGCVSLSTVLRVILNAFL